MEPLELVDAFKIKDPEVLVLTVLGFFEKINAVKHTDAIKLVELYSTLGVLYEAGFSIPLVREVKRAIKARMVLLKFIAPMHTREVANQLADMIRIDPRMTFSDKMVQGLL